MRNLSQTLPKTANPPRYFTIAKAIGGELGESLIAHRDLAQWEMAPWRSTTPKMDQVSKLKSVNSINQI